MRARTIVKWVAPALVILAALASVSCESSDPVAITGSNINLTASPNPVDVLADPLGQSAIQARVTTANGVPQEGTIVFFSTTVGTVTPDSDTTDSEGRAFTIFANTGTASATLTARSGGITATLTIQVIEGNPTSHTLVSADPVITGSCADSVTLTGTLLGSGGPIPGVTVTFSEVSGSAVPSTVTGNFGNFSPQATVTDSNGSYTATYTLDGQKCNDNCTSGGSCSIKVKATAAALPSNEVPISENL
jgi:hypothetical protein